MERPQANQERPAVRSVELTDYEDEPFYLLLRQLPPELAKRCIIEIEDQLLDDNAAAELIERRIAGRMEAVTETHFSDPAFEAFSEQYDGDLLKHIETDLFSDTDHQIGHGNTAKVHELDTHGQFDPVAVKYLIRPQEGTVSTRVEHNIVHEVKRITAVEKRLDKVSEEVPHIRVPHPYFHHTTDKIQCYGMEKINGVNLQSAIEGIISPELEDELDKVEFDLEALEKEVDRFFDAMHGYCLHGSVKTDNMMIDTQGRFFIVDFGNSTLLSEVSAGDEDWLEAKKAEEIAAAKRSIHQFLLSYEQFKLDQTVA